MKTKFSITVISAISMLLSACGMVIVSGSGKIVDETRNVQGYSRVVFSAPGELTIAQNGREGLVIETDDNLLRYIKTSVQGEILYIYVEPNMADPALSLKADSICLGCRYAHECENEWFRCDSFG